MTDHSTPPLVSPNPNAGQLAGVKLRGTSCTSFRYRMSRARFGPASGAHERGASG